MGKGQSASKEGCRLIAPRARNSFRLDDFTTVRIIQQARGTRLSQELKTPNSARFVDISAEVAALLREFLAGRTAGLVFPNRMGKPLNPSNIATVSFTPC